MKTKKNLDKLQIGSYQYTKSSNRQITHFLHFPSNARRIMMEGLNSAKILIQITLEQ
jgi:hypothetical protein